MEFNYAPKERCIMSRPYSDEDAAFDCEVASHYNGTCGLCGRLPSECGHCKECGVRNKHAKWCSILKEEQANEQEEQE